MIPRYAGSLVLGLLITFTLLWVMQVLIATGKKALVDEIDINIGDFILVKKEETLRRDDDEPDKPPEVDEPPPEAPPSTMDNLDTATTISINRFAASIDLNFGETGRIGLGEGDYLPIVRIEPQYPRRAQTRGLEGQCLMQFTVTTTGTTKDIVAVECTSSLFERASIAAVEKWKYKPRVTGGEPVEVPGVQTILTYEMED
jgi:protein TonB